MVSSTQQYSRIRRRKARSAGKVRKRQERANGTPRFPIHQPGYSPQAADAQPKAVATAEKK